MILVKYLESDLKMSQKIRTMSFKAAEFELGLIYGGTKESVTVRDVRLFPGMGQSFLRNPGGPGAERGIEVRHGSNKWH